MAASALQNEMSRLGEQPRLSVVPMPGRPAAPPIPAEKPVGSRLIRGLLFQWFTLVTLGSLLAGAAGAAAWMFLPPNYTSYALFHVGITETPLVDLNDRVGHLPSNEFATYMKTQSDLIRSHFVLVAALRDPTVASLRTIRNQPDPVKYLEQKLQVENQAGSQVLRLSLTDEIAEDLPKIVNAVQAAFLKEVVQDGLNKKRHQMLTLEDLISKRESELRGKLNQYNAALDTAGSENSTSTKDKLAAAQWLSLNDQLGRTKTERASLQAKLDRLKAKPSMPTELGAYAAEVEVMLDRDPSYVSLKNKAKQHRRNEKYYAEIAPGSGRSEAAAAAARDCETQMAEMKKKMEATYVESLERKRVADAETALATTRGELEAAEAREKLLTEQLAALPAPIDKSTARIPVDIQELQKDIANRERELAGMRHRHSALKLELEPESPTRVRELQKASAPISQDFKKRLFTSLFAAIAGFALVGGLCVGYEMLRGRVYGRTDLAEVVPVPVLGALPPYVSIAPGRQPSASQARQREQFEERVDELRAVLLRELDLRKAKVILITSAAGREGKTLLAGHLALSLTRAERRTVLLDGNFRRPAAHELFGEVSSPGVCEILRGEAVPVKRVTADGLGLMPAGTRDARTKDELARGKIGRLVARLAMEFDHIVIDSPSLSLPDTLMIAPYVDAVIIAVRNQTSRVADLTKALDKLKSVGAGAHGVVLMDA